MATISPNVFDAYEIHESRSAFPFTFSVVSATDVAVEIDGTPVTAGYSVSLAETGGTVTFDAPRAAGERIVILLRPDYLQTSEFADQGAYNLSTINTINRRATLRALATEHKARRALKVPLGEEGPEIALADVPSIVAVGNSLLEGSDIATVAGGIANIASVADSIANVTSVAGLYVAVNTVAAISTSVTTVSNISGDVATIAGASTNLNLIAGALGNINTVAANTIAVTTCATNIAAIIGAPAIAASVAAALPDANREFRQAAVPSITWSSARGSAEEVGDATFDSGRIVGGWVLATKDTLFNAIQTRMWATSFATAVEWKVWIRNTQSAFNMSSTAADISGTISDSSFPVEEIPYTIEFGTRLFAQSGKYIYWAVRAADDSMSLHIKTWKYDASVSPARRGILYYAGTAVGWNTTFNEGLAGPGFTFGQVAPRLLLLSGELKSYFDGRRPELLLAVPPEKYGVVGKECNLYFDTLLPEGASSFGFNVEPTGVAQNGKQQRERWTLTPTTANSSGTLELKIADRHTNIQLAQKSIALLIAAANAQSGTSKTALLLGDSLTADGTTAQTLIDNALAEPGGMGLTLIGTKGTGVAKHEGVGGITTNFYNGASGPFWIGSTVNFPQYLANNSYAIPDYIFIQLGTNNIRSLKFTDTQFTINTATNYITDITTLVANLRIAGSGIKIVVALPPWPATQDAWANAYGTSDKEQRAKRNYVLFYQMMISAFSGLESNNIFICGSNSSMDPEVAFPRVKQLKHARIPVAGNYLTYAAMLGDLAPAEGTIYTCSDIPNNWFVKVGPANKGRWREADELDGVVRRQTDALHPPTGGGAYKQIADEWWAMMKYLG
ncbi:MAG: hypothetical protein V4472_04950 [Pseudomonadota bacterium]